MARRSRNKPKFSPHSIQKLRKRYGMTPDEWMDLYHQQAGACAVCLKVPETTLNVDHCHATGRIRGLLCGECNRALGLLQDSPEIISRAAIFVARNQGV